MDQVVHRPACGIKINLNIDKTLWLYYGQYKYKDKVQYNHNLLYNFTFMSESGYFLVDLIRGIVSKKLILTWMLSN